MDKPILTQLKQKRRVQRRNYFIFVILWITAFILMAWLSTFLPKQWDISRAQRFSLTDSSQHLLEKVDGDINFTAFAGNNNDYRKAIRSIVEQYQQHHKHIGLSFIDPDQRPDLTRQYGIRQSGEVRLTLTHAGEERSEILRNISEVTISNAIMRLSRANERYVLFLDGHGERNPFKQANHDLNQFAKELNTKGFDVHQFNLATQDVIPDNAKFLVIASPQLNYLPQEVERLQQFVVRGGNLLWLTEPDGLKGLENLLISLGLESTPGTVIDPGTQSLNIGDASFTLISNYNNHPALSQFDFVTLFPQARAFNLLPMDTLWQSQALLLSGERTWLESETLIDQVNFDSTTDVRGPLNLGMSLVRDLDDDTQQRILVLGDGDFLSNRFLHNGANIPFALNIFDWLSGEEEFLDLHFSETTDVSLSLDEQQLAWLGVIFLLILPILCFLIASILWWRRRVG